MGQISANNVPLMKSPDQLGTWLALWGCIFMLVPIVMLGVNISYRLPPGLILSERIFLFIVGSCIILFIIRLSLHLRLLQSIERHRLALVSEIDPLLATSPSQSEILSPPNAITLISNRVFVWRGSLSLLLCGLFLLIPSLIGIFQVAGLFAFLALTVIGSVIFLAGLIFSMFSFLKSQRTIEVTPSGLQAEQRYYPTISKSHIDWEEGHFFARYTLPSLFPGQQTIYYELSSPTQIITWMSLPDPLSPFSIWKPQLPMDEYHQQIQKLCELISAKTALQLHNLTPSPEKKLSA